jgi:FixJ family two-component response regulator
MSLAPDIVYLIDDDTEILSSIATFLRDKHFEVRSFSSGIDFLKALPLAQPSVIILDMHMPSLSGLDIQKKLVEAGNQVPVLFLSGASESQQIINALKGGADEFLLKPVSPQVLLDCLNRVFESEHQKELELKNKLNQEALLRQLTKLEHEVLPHFIHGCSNKMIAESTHLKPDTIKKRRSQIYDKLQVENLAELLEKFGKNL